MSPRQVRILLWLFTAGCLSGALAAVIGVLSAPVAPPPLAAPTSPPTRMAAGGADLPPLASFQSLYSRPLRRALYDTAPPPPEAPKPPPPLNLRLAGTIIEEHNSKALVVGPDGKSRFIRVGETCAQARILCIESDRLVVEYFGKELVLQVEKGKR